MFRAEVCKPAGPVFFTLHDEKNTSNPWSVQVVEVLRRIGCDALLQRYQGEHRTILQTASLVVSLFDLDDKVEDPPNGWQVYSPNRIGVPSWTAGLNTSSIVAISSAAVASLGLTHRAAEEMRRFFVREYVKSSPTPTNVHSGVLPRVAHSSPRHARHHGEAFLRAPLFRR